MTNNDIELKKLYDDLREMVIEEAEKRELFSERI